MPLYDQLDGVLDTLGGLIAGTTPEQLALPTPCAKWQVRDLINHVVGGGHLFAAAFRGETVDIDGPMPDLLGDDPQTAWKGAIADFDAAVKAPGAMERTVPLPFGQLPAPVALDVAALDLTTHCWDLAQATGQRFAPSDALVEEAAAAARMLISPEARDGDTFAAEVPVAADAPALDRLVAFLGRQP